MYVLARVTVRVFLTMFALIAASTASAVTIRIDTTPGTSLQGPFGEPASPFFGQTLTPPLEATLLTSFAFFLEGFNDPGPVIFQGVVVEWDQSSFRPTGAELFQSGLRATAGGGGLQ